MENPNKKRKVVLLKDILNSLSKEKVVLPIGIDNEGKIWSENLIDYSGLLVAGATNTGKSVFFNSLIESLIYQSSPVNLQIILIDCKRVEYLRLKNSPYIFGGLIVENEKAKQILIWCQSEINTRYNLFNVYNVKNVEMYNQMAEKKLPNYIIIIDEFSDLMIYDKNFFEKAFTDIVIRGKCAGFSIVLGTSRPDPNMVITKKISNIFKNKLTFAMVTKEYSIVIINEAGAEKLLGKGDMLYKREKEKPVRLQGFYTEN